MGGRDFRTFELLDRDEGEEYRFALADLPAHVEKFGFILGVQRRTFRDQDPVNVEASELVARLHDALKASGYDGHDLELFLVRTVFCLFADDTGIFEPRDIFLDFVEERTAADGSDLGPWLSRLFQVLDTPEDRRQAKLDEDLARFPYVNGDLFSEPLRIPDFDAAMRQALLDACPAAEPYVRPYVGAHEYINGKNRWILWLGDAPPELLRREPALRERVAAVRELRQRSKSAPTRALAETPTLYHVNVIPEAPFLVIPKVSSERREYVPIGWLQPPTIPSDLVFVLEGATKPTFALLTSAMHMAWLRHIGGRLESRYRYSIGLVYNTFPLPSVPEADLEALTPHANAVLEARASHPGAAPADLYAPDLMPPDLRRAHRQLDRAVDRLYRRAAFASERERVEHLFTLYERLQAPLVAKAAERPKRNRRRTGP